MNEAKNNTLVPERISNTRQKMYGINCIRTEQCKVTKT